MVGYMVNPIGGLVSIGTSNPGFGIYHKAWRVGLGLGHSNPDLDCGKS